MSAATSIDDRPLEGRSSSEEAVQQIRDALRGLQFGSVVAIVQDGVVVQIERVEKRRLKNQRSESRGR